MTKDRPLSFLYLKQKKQKNFSKKEGLFNINMVILILPDKK